MVRQAFLGFELGQRCYTEKLVMSNSEGTERISYHPTKEDLCIDENGKVAKGLTYEGELNKVRALKEGNIVLTKQKLSFK